MLSLVFGHFTHFAKPPFRGAFSGFGCFPFFFCQKIFFLKLAQMDCSTSNILVPTRKNRLGGKNFLGLGLRVMALAYFGSFQSTDLFQARKTFLGLLRNGTRRMFPVCHHVQKKNEVTGTRKHAILYEPCLALPQLTLSFQEETSEKIAPSLLNCRKNVGKRFFFRKQHFS